MIAELIDRACDRDCPPTDIPQTLDGICVILGVGRISSWEENLWNKSTAVKP
jgi:hypothetical protein